jgi:hypothetical protein
MILLRGTPEQVVGIQRRQYRGLLAWLHGDGVLIIPDGVTSAAGGGDFLRELEQAMGQPVQAVRLTPVPSRHRWFRRS